MNVLQLEVMTKIGLLYLVASDEGLRSLFFRRSEDEMVTEIPQGSTGAEFHLREGAQQLTEYFEGKRREFDLKLEIRGTEFQKKVWSELQKIPYGKTRSYREVAELVGTKAIRAVGTANGRNPLCLVIPCHRVIASNGGLGGFSGGLPVKAALLELERGESVVWPVS